MQIFRFITFKVINVYKVRMKLHRSILQALAWNPFKYCLKNPSYGYQRRAPRTMAPPAKAPRATKAPRNAKASKAKACISKAPKPRAKAPNVKARNSRRSLSDGMKSVWVMLEKSFIRISLGQDRLGSISSESSPPWPIVVAKANTSNNSSNLVSNRRSRWSS